jgi:hypothetical protein
VTECLAGPGAKMLRVELSLEPSEAERAMKTYQSLYELDADEMKKRLIQNLYALALMSGRLDNIRPRNELPEDFYINAYKTLVEDSWVLQGLLREVECNPSYIGRISEELRDYEYHIKQQEIFENLRHGHIDKFE